MVFLLTFIVLLILWDKYHKFKILSPKTETRDDKARPLIKKYIHKSEQLHLKLDHGQKLRARESKLCPYVQVQYIIIDMVTCELFYPITCCKEYIQPLSFLKCISISYFSWYILTFRTKVCIAQCIS